jgi:hypoxanthine-guanine phosphoribosyltransferase
MAKAPHARSSAPSSAKPQAIHESINAFAWDVPDAYLIGYGVDDAGRYRALPYIAALD